MTIEPLLHAFADVVRAKTISELGRVVTGRVRGLLGADGCTLVLREDGLCHYADEDAISPLWKGRRFPMSACISGWVMRECDYAVIEDIRSDLRIPQDLYLATFVRSLAMVPIDDPPVGAIGAYWSTRHRATDFEIECLRTLADAVSLTLSTQRDDGGAAAHGAERGGSFGAQPS